MGNLAPRIEKFPVFFPVSREFSRRRVSARLPAPPRSQGRRENRLLYHENCWKSPQFRNSSSETGPEKVSCRTPQRGSTAFFSVWQTRSPVSTTPSGEWKPITLRLESEQPPLNGFRLHTWVAVPSDNEEFTIPRSRTGRLIAHHKLVGHAEQVPQHVGADAGQPNEHSGVAAVGIRHVK